MKRTRPKLAWVGLFVVLASLAAGLVYHSRSPTIDPSDDAELMAFADHWIAVSGEAGGGVARQHWPAAVRRLDPTDVYVSRAGVYFRQGEFFVEEWGVFIPRAGETMATPGSDPAYEVIRSRLYAYRIKG